MREPVRNSIEAFICNNVAAALDKEGYGSSEVDLGVNEALRFYRTTCTFKKGKVFESCLAKAKAMVSPAKKSKPKAKKEAA
ncbi:hypothetical protein [Photobacterium sp. TLY01]|uniref:hypothetical protein n=1 Tax=Photobacterium sp. TLY01 TaxID=2907534 RepID=UPI001F2FAE9C|nr:hypothetical protein [Photobacterium sp. TLY01]UIP28857.1 hypothetical protein LN341_05095 [Photobacterium sp. TLY01]